MYRVIRFYARYLACAHYHRSIEGAPIPEEGPLVLVANHTGGLVDVALLIVHLPRPLRFLAKYTLFDMPGLSSLARGIGAIPIYRKKDNVDTSLNEDAFAAVHAALAAGEVVAIFPEGTSEGAAPRHPELRKLKTGAARMALGAEAEAGFGLGVRILPVGVVYEDRDRFRSVVHLRMGEPLEVARWRERFAQDPREAAEGLTADIDGALRRATATDQLREMPRPRSHPVGTSLRFLVSVLFVLPALASAGIARAVRPTPDKVVTTTLLAGTVLALLWLAAIVIACLRWLPPLQAWLAVALLLASCLLLPAYWTRVERETR